MRKLIDIVTSLQESAVSPDWNLGGCWITDSGEIEHCDHGNDIHHSHIALDHFGDESMTDDDGEYDEYSRDTAQEIAYSEGWIRISTRGTSSFSVEWQTTPTAEAQRTLLKMVASDSTTYQTYEVEYPASGDHAFHQVDDAKEFLAVLRRALRA